MSLTSEKDHYLNGMATIIGTAISSLLHFPLRYKQLKQGRYMKLQLIVLFDRELQWL